MNQLYAPNEQAWNTDELAVLMSGYCGIRFCRDIVGYVVVNDWNFIETHKS